MASSYRTGGVHETSSDYGYNANSSAVDVTTGGAGKGQQQFNQDGKNGAGGIGSSGTKSSSKQR